MIHAPPPPINDCIAYHGKKSIDTHGAYDKATDTFTLPTEGLFIVKTRDGKLHRYGLSMGTKIEHPVAVVGDKCGKVYEYAKKQEAKENEKKK